MQLQGEYNCASPYLEEAGWTSNPFKIPADSQAKGLHTIIFSLPVNTTVKISCWNEVFKQGFALSEAFRIRLGNGAHCWSNSGTATSVKHQRGKAVLLSIKHYLF